MDMNCENAVRSCIDEFGTFEVLDAMISEMLWTKTIHGTRGKKTDEMICLAADSMMNGLQGVRDQWAALAVAVEIEKQGPNFNEKQGPNFNKKQGPNFNKGMK